MFSWIIAHKRVLLYVIIGLSLFVIISYSGKKTYNIISDIQTNLNHTIEITKLEVEKKQVEILQLKSERDFYFKEAANARAKYDALSQSIKAKLTQAQNVQIPKNLAEASSKLKQLGYDNEVRN